MKDDRLPDTLQDIKDFAEMEDWFWREHIWVLKLIALLTVFTMVAILIVSSC